jgi:hypothetical protein
MKHTVFYGALLCLAVSLIGSVFSVEVVSAAPGKPCDTWGTIKSCFGDNPAPCCRYTKNTREVYNELASAYGYPLLEETYPKEIETDLSIGQFFLGKRQASAEESSTWGGIKALFAK